MSKYLLIIVVLLMALLLSATAFAGGGRVVATLHGMDMEQGEGGGGPLYEDGTASGNFAISVLNGALIFTVHLDAWYYEDADHIVTCGALTIQKNDLGIPLPDYICTTPVPISGFPVRTDFDGDGRFDHMEWVRLINQ
jgi:hypothetical protein